MNKFQYTHNKIPLNKIFNWNYGFDVFFSLYHSIENKSDFLDNHKYLKYRELYFSLFATRVYDLLKKQNHLMIIPDEDLGDVGICARRSEGGLNLFPYDVKEFHSKYERSFEELISEVAAKKKVIEKRYGLIIALNKDLVPTSLERDALIALSRHLPHGIFLLSAFEKEIENPYVGRCVFLLDGSSVFNETVYLEKYITEHSILYEDVLNWKEL